MFDPQGLESHKSLDVLHSAGWFVFGITTAASGWFSVTTASAGLRNLVPPNIALFAAIGLQSGILSSAYFFARFSRRRVYWLAAYLLTAAVLVSLSYVGMGKVLAAGMAPGGEQPAVAGQSLTEGLLTLRHLHPAEAVRLAIAVAFILIPLLGLLGTRAEQSTFPEKVASLRRRMKEIASQVESTEGLFPWGRRIAARVLFNRPVVDPLVANLQVRLLALRETVQDSLVSLEIPSFLHEKLSLRLLEMCSEAGGIAAATQGKLDHQGLLALTDCLDAVQSCDLTDSIKEEARKLLLDHFKQFHNATRRFTSADGWRTTSRGKETFTYAGSERPSLAEEQYTTTAPSG